MEDFHLLRIVLLQPLVLAYIVMQEPDGILSRDFLGILGLHAGVMPVEPRLCPPTDGILVMIDADPSLDVDGLHIYFKISERIKDPLAF